MERTPVKSSQIASIGHDGEVLEVEFKGKYGNTIYRYPAPADVHQRLLDADADPEQSVGKVFHELVKTAKDEKGNPLYPHTKVSKEGSMNKPAVFTADSLIEAFGDQAYHKGVRMVVECLHVGDHESCRQLSQANIELLKRGYHKHPEKTQEKIS